MSLTKAIIFDGDGTLWRPIEQGSNARPDAVYHDKHTKNDSHLHLRLIEDVKDMLIALKESEYSIFVVSAHPDPGDKALEELRAKLVTLGIYDLVDGYYCSDGNNANGKTEIIRRIVIKYKFEVSDVYMVGDSYYFDYVAGLNTGINSFFIKNNYCKQPSPLPNDAQVIDSVTTIIDRVSR